MKLKNIVSSSRCKQGLRFQNRKTQAPRRAASYADAYETEKHRLLVALRDGVIIAFIHVIAGHARNDIAGMDLSQIGGQVGGWGVTIDKWHNLCYNTP